MHQVTYFPLLVADVFLKRKYSYTNITELCKLTSTTGNTLCGCVY